MKAFSKNIVVICLAAVAGLVLGVFGVFRALELRKNYRLEQEDPSSDNRVFDHDSEADSSEELS